MMLGKFHRFYRPSTRYPYIGQRRVYEESRRIELKREGGNLRGVASGGGDATVYLSTYVGKVGSLVVG